MGVGPPKGGEPAAYCAGEPFLGEFFVFLIFRKNSPKTRPTRPLLAYYSPKTRQKLAKTRPHLGANPGAHTHLGGENVHQDVKMEGGGD